MRDTNPLEPHLSIRFSSHNRPDFRFSFDHIQTLSRLQQKIEIQSENLFGFSYNYTQGENEEWVVLIQGFANNLNKRIEETLQKY